MFRLKGPMVKISIRKGVLDSIFDECDRFAHDETGGKIIGTFVKKGAKYEIDIAGVIDAGRNARRSPTSLFQDGEYQERVFRSVEKENPEIEHLGTWHTHHVNGLATLSSGDQETYRRIVNHPKQNTGFFYALLVVRKTRNSDHRYEIKHYFLYRDDDEIYEIPEKQIQIIEKPSIQLPSRSEEIAADRSAHRDAVINNVNLERVRDQEYLADLHPTFKAAFSKQLDCLYWKGSLDLIDDSRADVVIAERMKDGGLVYSVAILGHQLPVPSWLDVYEDRTFKSARHALVHLKNDIDHKLYSHKKG
jgi:proteasome lid subunit RPN8/RPN11